MVPIYIYVHILGIKRVYDLPLPDLFRIVSYKRAPVFVQFVENDIARTHIIKRNAPNDI